ncbi:cytochrome P450 [Citricoccus sp.]|uniref:cytochrome P450 n=1 Tax=Citricoccus sp. TaxID=1978372 RepID=UPI0028BE4710|nr:cytochrome P450 [Citricoccus sp.]
MAVDPPGTAAVRPLTGSFTLPRDDPDAVFAAYAELRSARPAAYTEDLGGYWALTAFEDVRAAASDSETFISSVKAVVPSDPRGIRRPPLNFDAPRHTPFRRALNRTLAPARVAALSDRIAAQAETLFDDFVRGDDDDITRTFGTMLPAYAEATWLNLDPERVAWLARTATAWVEAWRRQDGAEVTRHSEGMYEVARWLVADRRSNPRDPREDPASSLLSERSNGQELDEEHIVGALRQSLVVGMVAPPLLIGGITRHLALDPHLHTSLRGGEVPLNAALEEFLRMYTPYRGFARTVSHPVDVAGERLLPGEPVTLVYAAANRDPDEFPDPDRFDASRPNLDRHLGFGRGRHQCVGQHLARGIIRAALEVLVHRASRLELVGEPEPTRMPELGYQSVRVRVLR